MLKSRFRAAALPSFVLTCVVMLAPAPSRAETAGKGNSDTHIHIRNGEDIDRRDFEVVSGDEEVSGDPESGRKAGYASWKTACADWKKEMKENNKDNQILTLNCGTPTSTTENGLYTFTSRGSYKLRVRIRAPGT